MGAQADMIQNRTQWGEHLVFICGGYGMPTTITFAILNSHTRRSQDRHPPRYLLVITSVLDELLKELAVSPALRRLALFGGPVKRVPVVLVQKLPKTSAHVHNLKTRGSEGSIEREGKLR
jgi:hypothetical protein